MLPAAPYTLFIDHAFDEAKLQEGVYLVILHAIRVPPHIGLIAGGHYYSLSIKGQELDVPVAALVRNVMLRKIPALFIRIGSGKDELREEAVAAVRRFPKVEAGKSTCLSPVKLFFEKNYRMPAGDVKYIFELLPKLDAQGLTGAISSLHIAEGAFQLPFYTMDEINVGIAKAEQEAGEIMRAAKS